MSEPPQHLSGRTLAPGALLALLVTTAALFALAVLVAVGPDGPARLWLGGGGNTVLLKPRDAGSGAVRLGDEPAGLLPGGSSAGLVSGVTLGSPVAAADRPDAVQLRAVTRVQRRRAARTPTASPPDQIAPAATPSPLQPVSAAAVSAPAPVATPAPGSTVVKVRGRGTSPGEVEVRKQRVPNAATPAPTPAPPSSSPTPAPVLRSGVAAPAPAPPAPPAPPALRPARPGKPPAPGVGAGDGVLHRVPPTRP